MLYVKLVFRGKRDFNIWFIDPKGFVFALHNLRNTLPSKTHPWQYKHGHTMGNRLRLGLVALVRGLPIVCSCFPYCAEKIQGEPQ